MNSGRLFSILRDYRPFLISGPVAAIWAWLGWIRISTPNVNDTGGWFDRFAKVFMTAWTTICVFAIVAALFVAIERAIRNYRRR
jgi:hypothetical protein